MWVAGNHNTYQSDFEDNVSVFQRLLITVLVYASDTAIFVLLTARGF